MCTHFKETLFNIIVNIIVLYLVVFRTHQKLLISYVLCFIGTQLSTGAAIETYRRGHRNLPARPSKMTGAAIEAYRRGHRNLPARPSKPTGAAIENDRRGHRNLPARPSKPTGAAIEKHIHTYMLWISRPHQGFVSPQIIAQFTWI